MGKLTREKSRRYENLLDSAMYGHSITKDEWEEMERLYEEYTGNPWRAEHWNANYNTKGTAKERILKNLEAPNALET